MLVKGATGLLSGEMSYQKISLNLKATKFGVKIIVLFWNLTGAFAAAETPVKSQKDQF